MRDLGDRHIKPLAKAILQTLDDVPFLLEGVRLLHVDLKREHSDNGTRHAPIIATGRRSS